MIRTEYMVYEMYPQIKPCLPQSCILFIQRSTPTLSPNLEPKCREDAICQKIRCCIHHWYRDAKLSDGKNMTDAHRIMMIIQQSD